MTSQVPVSHMGNDSDVLDIYILFLCVLAEPLLLFQVLVFFSYVTQLILVLTFVLNWMYNLSLSLCVCHAHTYTVHRAPQRSPQTLPSPPVMGPLGDHRLCCNSTSMLFQIASCRSRCEDFFGIHAQGQDFGPQACTY